jgi:hypothetical protein
VVRAIFEDPWKQLEGLSGPPEKAASAPAPGAAKPS